MANKYIAFISYRHAEMDSAIAKTLHSLIEQYRIPRGIRKNGENRLGVVFRDQEELHAASDLSSEIQHALNSTEYLIVICSKNSVESPWVTREVDHFLQNHDRSQVLTILASGEPMEVFPPQLTRTPEGEPIEPLAVDIRADSIAASRKKLRRELPRLISAILKCPYDALVMREHRRKTRRITTIAAGIMAILLGFTSTVLLKNQQIALANDQLEVKNTELNQANVALEEQKAEVQLRESQLLVQSALEDLDNADYYGAMEKALSALPKDEADSRPYYAPAEQVLMEAMGVFQTGQSEAALNTTILEQVTNISDFVITEDGTRVLTADEFGTVFCFDAESGEQLWSRYAVQEDKGVSTMHPHLFPCNQDQAVILSTKKTLRSFDMVTGDLLWSLDTGWIADNYLFYHKDRNILLFVSQYTSENSNGAYQLAEVDATTGELLQTIPLFESSSMYACSFSDYFSTVLSKAGSFYDNGTRFYGAFFDDTQRLQCFDADLTAGTCRIVYTSEEPLLTGASVVNVYMDPGNALYVVCADTKQDYLFSALKTDPNTGELLWWQDVAAPGITYSWLYDEAYCLFLDTSILTAYGDHFFLTDLQTGELLQTQSVPARITSLGIVSDIDFSFSLDNGTYAIGWVSNNNIITLTTDANWNVFAELEPHQSLRVWGGGIVQLFTDGTSFRLGIGNFVSPGSVLLIPEQQKNTLHIIRPVQTLFRSDLTTIQMPDDDLRLFSDSTARSVGSGLVVGSCYRSSSSANAHLILDPATQQITEVFNHPKTFWDDDLFWMPDTFQPLICEYRKISLLNEDGAETLLYDYYADSEIQGEEDGWYASSSLFRCATNYQADGTSLLSAACNTKTLQLWTNGIFTSQTDLPDALMIDPRESNSKERLLKIGPNGKILVSLHNYEDAIPLECIQIYHPDKNTWTSFRSDAVFSDENAIVFAQKKSLMAGLDQNGTVRLLDLDTGNTVGRFSTQIPSGSVLSMQFFLDDTHLAIKAAGGHLLIYDLTTGTQVYRKQFSKSYSDPLQIFEDLQRGRIYLNCGYQIGLCLDLASWSTLATIENFLYYDSSTNLVYLSVRDYNNPSLVCGKVPDTMELIKLATKTLADQQ